MGTSGRSYQWGGRLTPSRPILRPGTPRVTPRNGHATVPWGAPFGVEVESSTGAMPVRAPDWIVRPSGAGKPGGQ